jgi:hypothetical protein
MPRRARYLQGAAQYFVHVQVGAVTRRECERERENAHLSLQTLALIIVTDEDNKNAMIKIGGDAAATAARCWINTHMLPSIIINYHPPPTISAASIYPSSYFITLERYNSGRHYAQIRRARTFHNTRRAKEKSAQRV